MLNNKKVNVVLSIIIAVCMWAYVIGETNPKATKTFHNVPISFVNEDVLDSSNLAVLDVSSTVIDITVTGSRAKLNKVEPEEISATVDYGEAALGKNELKVNVKVPDYLEIEEKSINKVTVNVEHKAYKDVDVVPYFNGEFNEDQEPMIVETGRSQVDISGAATKVESVYQVRAEIEASDVTNELNTISCSLVPVTKDGTEVSNVDVYPGSTKVTVVLVSKKTVPLEVPVVDNSEDDIIRKTSSPKTITLKGRAKDIEKISSIKSKPVDITGITEETSLPIELDLPEGVQLSDQSFDMKTKVTIEKLSEKQFTFKSSDVRTDNLKEGLKVTAGEGEIKVTIKGRKEIENIKKESIILSVDLSQYDEGEYDVTIKVTAPKEAVSFAAEPQIIKLSIEKK